MTVIIEIRFPNGVVQHHRWPVGPELSLKPLVIGRGYDCDVIVADDYLSARHFSLSVNDGGEISISDLASENGTWLQKDDDQGLILQQPHIVSLGSEIHAGKTVFRLVAPETAVAPARKLHVADGRERQWLGQNAAWLQLLLVLGLTLLTAYLEQNERDKHETLVAATTGMGVFVLVWAGGWAFLSRLLTHNANFRRHVSVVCGALSLGVLFDFLLDTVTFSTERIEPAWYSPYSFISVLATIAYLLLLLGLLSRHLKFATHLRRWARWGVAGILPALLLSGAALMAFLERNEPASHNVDTGVMLPLAMRVAPVQSEQAYVDGLDALEKTARKEAGKQKSASEVK